MVERSTPWPAGTPCWVDTGFDDLDAAQTFYGEVFGWTFEAGPPETGGYSLILQNGKQVGGIGPKMNPNQPTAWITYLATDDVDDTVEKVTANGGTIVMPAMDVMDFGRMALASDPAGAFFGLWQSRQNTGFQIANEPGSVTWNENFSRDWEANKAFYQAVVGYRYDDMSAEGFQYATFSVGELPCGGIGQIDDSFPAEVPAHWMTYFAVEDCDETVTLIEKLGGKIMSPAKDTPYGRMAAAIDPQGGVFSVIKNAPPPSQG